MNDMQIAGGSRVQTEPNDFVHVLLFRCMNCGLPVVQALTTDSKNLEEIDLNFHNIVCRCGWSGQASGLEAKRHWIESWSKSLSRNRQPD